MRLVNLFASLLSEQMISSLVDPPVSQTFIKQYLISTCFALCIYFLVSSYTCTALVPLNIYYNLNFQPYLSYKYSNPQAYLPDSVISYYSASAVYNSNLALFSLNKENIRSHLIYVYHDLELRIFLFARNLYQHKFIFFWFLLYFLRQVQNKKVIVELF